MATPLKIVLAAAVANTVATDPAPVSSIFISLLSDVSVVVAYTTVVEPLKSTATPNAPKVELEPVPSVYASVHTPPLSVHFCMPPPEATVLPSAM
jgi:hypothetical protein